MLYEVITDSPDGAGRVISCLLTSIFWEKVSKLWRTGSDEATSSTFSTPVTLNGTAIDTGSYEIFTIPGESVITSYSIHYTKLYEMRCAIARIRFESPINAPNLTASKELSVQLAPAAFRIAAAGMMECFGESAT